jgi:hypothetical protein
VKVKFLMICRPEPDILEFDVNGHLLIDSGEVNADLSKFIQAKVDDLSRRKEYPPKLRHDIEDTLRMKAGGTFLWAPLVLEDLRKTILSSEVRKKSTKYTIGSCTRLMLSI